MGPRGRKGMAMSDRSEQRSSPAFSLVEVVLAVLILGIGLIAVLQLVPVGISSRRDALVENYSSHSADTLLHTLKVALRDPDNDYANWQQLGQSLPDDKTDIPTSVSGWGKVGAWSSSDMRFFVPESVAPPQGSTAMPDSIALLKIEHHNPETQRAEFSAMYRVWREPVSYYPYDPETDQWADSPVTVTSDVAMALNTEVSLPPDIPYENRQKTFFHVEVFKSDSQ